MFLPKAGDKSPIDHIYLPLSFLYLWQTWVCRLGRCSLWSQFMRSHLSLCVNDKVTSAGRLIDSCSSGPPKAWLLSCGATLSGTQIQCSGSFGLSTLGDHLQNVRKPLAGRTAAGVLGAEESSLSLLPDILSFHHYPTSSLK